MRNAQATFQSSLELILSVVKFKTCLVYLDDVLIFSRKFEGHSEHVDEVHKLLENAGVLLKIHNCQLFRKNLEYHCNVLHPGRIAIAKDTTYAISDAMFPEDITQLHSSQCV